jgi:hypothetical protein
MRRAFFLGALLSAGHASAFQTDLRLDPFSFIQQSGPEGQRYYSFPANARMHLVFGVRTGDAIPLTLPPGGLELGVATGEGLPPLELSLAETAQGSLAVHPDGSGTLTLQAAVLAKRVGGLQVARYDLALSVDIVRMGQTAQGWVQMIAADEVATPEGAPPQQFYAAIGGTLDALPPGFE